MKKTRKSLVLSIVTLLLCSCMFIGSTLAWFTDSVSNTGNKIQAGTLDIDMLEKGTDGSYKSIGGSAQPVFNYNLWEPGYSDGGVFEIVNKGNLALKYVLQIAVANGTLPENAEGHTLADAIDVYFVESESDITMPASFDAAKSSLTKVGTLADVLDASSGSGFAYGVLLPAGGDKAGVPAEFVEQTRVEKTYVALVLHMQDEAGNEYQGMELGASFDIRLVATQFTYEKDGFGVNTYDANANIEPLPNPVHEVAKKQIPSDIRGTDGAIGFDTTGNDTMTYASVDAVDAKAILDAEIEAHSGDTVNVSLSMEVETTEVTNDSLTFDISMFKTVTVNSGAPTTTPISSLTSLAVAKLKLDAGLQNVKVNHSGTPMAKLTSEDEAKEGYFYDEANGNLTIKTKSFSPFEVTFGEKIERDWYVKSVVVDGDKATATTATVTYKDETTGDEKTEQVRYLTAKNIGAQTTNTTFDLYCGNELVKANATFSNCSNASETWLGRDVVEFPKCKIYDQGDSYLNSSAIFMIGAKNADGSPATEYHPNGSGCVSYKGLQFQNRVATSEMKPRTFYFENFVFDGAAQQNKWGHLITMTCYDIMAQFNNVEFKGLTQASRTSVIGVWANDANDDGTYPTNKDGLGVDVRFVDCKVTDCGSKPIVQFQTFAPGVVSANPKCYSYISIRYDEASKTNCGFDKPENGAFTTQGNNNLHDGIHSDWFVNGASIEVPGEVKNY